MEHGGGTELAAATARVPAHCPISPLHCTLYTAQGILGREDVSKNPEEYCSSFDPQFGTSLATSRRLAVVGSSTTKFARNGATFSATGLDRMVSQLPQLLPGFSNQCTQTDSGYVPTPALMALVCVCVGVYVCRASKFEVLTTAHPTLQHNPAEARLLWSLHHR